MHEDFHITCIKNFEKKTFQKDRPKIQPGYFFNAKFNDVTKTGVVISARLLKNAIVLNHCLIVFFSQTKI